MKKFFLITLVLTFFFTSCDYFSKHTGFSKTETGIYYKLHIIGEEVNPAKSGNYVTVDLNYKTINDSSFFHEQRTFKITKPDYKGSIDECFLMLSKGDSSTFIIDADNFFTKTLKTSLPQFIANNSQMKVDIKMNDIRTEEQYTTDKEEFLKWIEDFGDYEKTILKRFIDEQKVDVEPTKSGLYFFTVKKGDGKKVKKGDLITIDYDGRFLNGKFFDSTKKRQQPFDFVYGSELQVIPGLEEAIGMMEQGEKAVVIIPSSLAFGDNGSSTGIIPPFTSLIYEIEIINVKTKK
ncbi:MAG: FKBP-type peptidyl-prolyl cis-trans isomerase [Bacteroidales bacterium]|nr:FKBP-type peptidyl-prolyl cis-trans isomerase [Bacteroidales bacterium]